MDRHREMGMAIQLKPPAKDFTGACLRLDASPNTRRWDSDDIVMTSDTKRAIPEI